MKHSRLYRRALSACTAVAMLAGCGAPSLMPQSSATAAHVGRSKSWMLPEAKREDLLYVASGCPETCIFSYPGAKIVGRLDVPAYGLCSNNNGDVFFPSGGFIYEYAHGGTKPIKTLKDATENANGCSVDPTTGNLAVINEMAYYSGAGSVAIYKGTRLERTYYDPDIYFMEFCTFDDKGNLFVDGINDNSNGFVLAELTKNGRQFKNISVDAPISAAGGLQWNRNRLVIGSAGASISGESTLYKLAIHGSSAKMVGSISLDDSVGLGPFRIQGDTLIGSDDSRNSSVQFWKYPAGGESFKSLTDFPLSGGVTISLSPR
jgi:hypothetical protein